MEQDYTELNKKLKELYERTKSNDRKCKAIKYGDTYLISGIKL